MKPEDYEYRDLIASTWDVFRGDTSNWEDRLFFRDIIIRHGHPALDVGCGTGRLLLGFLSDGIDIDGVDVSPDMLALCRAKARKLGLRPRLFQQAMDALDLPRKYQTIIVPSSSFQLLTDVGLAGQAMERFYEHLRPGGVLVMPFMILWREGDPIQTEWEITGEEVRPEDGALARRWSRARYDVENQLEYTEDRYEVILDGQVITSERHRRSPATRWYTQFQAIDLFEGVGLTRLRVFSGFSRQPASDQDKIFSVVGTRPRI
jgi:SAM-dependent methyltransferase